MADTYRVVITPEALSDLKDISKYIRKSSSLTTARVIDDILKGIESLAFMPSRCRRIGKSRKRGQSVHALLVHPFIVHFRLVTDTSAVYILSVRNGTRRQPRQFE